MGVRWVVCFVVLPAVWAAASAATSFQAVWMVPAAVGVAAVSSLIAYNSGLDAFRKVGYFLGTGAAMGGAFILLVYALFAYYCRDDFNGCA